MALFSGTGFGSPFGAARDSGIDRNQINQRGLQWYHSHSQGQQNVTSGATINVSLSNTALQNPFSWRIDSNQLYLPRSGAYLVLCKGGKYSGTGSTSTMVVRAQTPAGVTSSYTMARTTNATSGSCYWSFLKVVTLVAGTILDFRHTASENNELFTLEVCILGPIDPLITRTGQLA